MKQVTLEWDVYVKELEDQYQKGYSVGGRYALVSMKKGIPYPPDVEAVLDELKEQEEKQDSE